MQSHSPFATVALAAVAWALGLAAVAWLATAVLDRSLSVLEWLLGGVALAVAVGMVAMNRQQRRRREIEDMRDSALW